MLQRCETRALLASHRRNRLVTASAISKARQGFSEAPTGVEAAVDAQLVLRGVAAAGSGEAGPCDAPLPIAPASRWRNAAPSPARGEALGACEICETDSVANSARLQ